MYNKYNTNQYPDQKDIDFEEIDSLPPLTFSTRPSFNSEYSFMNFDGTEYPPQGQGYFDSPIRPQNQLEIDQATPSFSIDDYFKNNGFPEITQNHSPKILLEQTIDLADFPVDSSGLSQDFNNFLEPKLMKDQSDQGSSDSEENYECNQVESGKNRQSKYKNAYSLVEEHIRRLLKDLLSLDSSGLNQVINEGRKSEAAQKREDRQLMEDYQRFELVDRKCDDLKEKLKHLADAKKKLIEPNDLDNELNLYAMKKKNQQKELLEKLKYRRLGLVSSLLRLVDDTSSAFIQRKEFTIWLNKNPKTRALRCMKDHFKQNIKFGLIILKFALKLLSPTIKTQNGVLSKSDIAFKFWLIKTPMKGKNKELFRNEISRAHIRGKFEEIYWELREIAERQVSTEDLECFDTFFGSLEENTGVTAKIVHQSALSQDFEDPFDKCRKRVNLYIDNKEATLKKRKRQ